MFSRKIFCFPLRVLLDLIRPASSVTGLVWRGFHGRKRVNGCFPCFLTCNPLASSYFYFIYFIDDFRHLLGWLANPAGERHVQCWHISYLLQHQQPPLILFHKQRLDDVRRKYNRKKNCKYKKLVKYIQKISFSKGIPETSALFVLLNTAALLYFSDFLSRLCSPESSLPQRKVLWI